MIGGGPAGLVAAARLAGAGIETTLLEASAGLGGRAATEHRDGFDLNQGPHALYVGGPGMRELEALGVDPARWNPVSHRSVFVRGGRARRSTGGELGVGSWLVREAIRRDPAELAGTSVTEWLRGTIRSEAARAAAGSLVRVTTFVADHDSLSADVAAHQIKIGLFPGVRYLKGGWQPMIDALAGRATAEGATIRTRSGVRSVAKAPDGWTVSLDDEELTAEILLVAAGVPEAFEKLLGEDSPQPPGPAAELSTLDIGFAGRAPREGRRFALGVDEPTYLSRHSAPEQKDRRLLALASYARGPREALEQMADAVQPGWRDRAILERFLPRMVAVSSIATPQSGGLSGRPGVDRGDGLFLAGDWLGSKGWLTDAAIASAAAAATAAIRSATAVAV